MKYFQIIFPSLLLLLNSFDLVAEDTESNYVESLNIHNAISSYSEKSGKEIIVDPRLQGNVVVSGFKVSNITYEKLGGMLYMLGYAMREINDTIYIEPTHNFKQFHTELVGKKKLSSFSAYEMVTKVIKIKHVNAARLIPILRPLMAQSSHMASAGTHILVTGRAINVERIQSLVKSLDTKENAEWEKQRRERSERIRKSKES